ncbi:hypothetical protein EVAR_90028_1 [Eumeta japonica]|uniref:Uncharacterized protein n=1 Tax=Eumeta variegata TaxID=151549 RepID=A0A4C1WXK4_EUMVA|nr:hypothetical protein EVAR_90028_1 [Eumeta japonica]
MSYTGGGASRKLLLSEQEQRLLAMIRKSAIVGRGPEIGFQNVAVGNATISIEAKIICTEIEIITRDPQIISKPLNVKIPAEEFIVQQTENQPQLSLTPALAIPTANHLPSIQTNTEDEEDEEPPRTAGPSTHRVDRRHRQRPTPFQMASVQFTEIVQRGLDLAERRPEVERLREENIA